MATGLGDWFGDGLMAKSYKPIDAGIKVIGQSPELAAVALSAARSLASAASVADPSGRYEAAPKTVVAGWANDRRVGAVVREVSPSWRGRRERTLARVSGLMRARGS